MPEPIKNITHVKPGHTYIFCYRESDAAEMLRTILHQAEHGPLNWIDAMILSRQFGPEAIAQVRRETVAKYQLAGTSGDHSP